MPKLDTPQRHLPSYLNFLCRGSALWALSEFFPSGATLGSPNPPRPFHTRYGEWGANADSLFGDICKPRALPTLHSNPFFFAFIASNRSTLLEIHGVRMGNQKQRQRPALVFLFGSQKQNRLSALNDLWPVRETCL
jgi:hypothetical protein